MNHTPRRTEVPKDMTHVQPPSAAASVVQPHDRPDGTPATVALMTAARTLGIGRTKAYELAKRGEFPCRVIKIGDRCRVPFAALLRLLDGPDHNGTAQDTP